VARVCFFVRYPTMASRLELFALFGCFLAFGDAVTQPEFDCRARQVMPEAVAGSASCMNMCCTDCIRFCNKLAGGAERSCP
jgi:hypothetical protein